MAEIRNLQDPQGRLLAHAAVPEKYTAGAALVNQIQSERVPFFITAHAVDASRNVIMYGLSDEMYTTYVDPILKQTIRQVPNAILSSFRDFIEPEDYLGQFAAALSQLRLTPVATADLPSIIGSSIQESYRNFMQEYQSYFDLVNNSIHLINT